MKFKHVVLVIFSSFIGASIALYALQSNQKTELPPNVQAVLSSPVQT
ncbi:MAG: hypothetical protein ACI9QR_001815, partial [Flavobacteriaceae bacterium]